MRIIGNGNIAVLIKLDFPGTIFYQQTLYTLYYSLIAAFKVVC